MPAPPHSAGPGVKTDPVTRCWSRQWRALMVSDLASRPYLLSAATVGLTPSPAAPLRHTPLLPADAAPSFTYVRRSTVFRSHLGQLVS